MNPDKLKAWLCMKSAKDLSLRSSLELLKRYPDPGSFVGNPDHPVYHDGSLKETTASYLSKGILPDSTGLTLELMQRHQISFTCYGDDNYPLGLKSILSPPLILYYKGDLSAALNNVCLAVVGTRKPSAYGLEMCRKVLLPACEKGVTIVSGLAFGIDTAAHNSALAAKSRTIAVLASGLESIYPPANLELSTKIAKHGALVSEYEPGTKMERWNFPARNRIISALSQLVLIVEGPESSGAMLTARFAFEQSREVCAIPGNINNRNASGPNRLIQQGAKLISHADDLLKLLGLDSTIDEQMEIIPELSIEEQTVYDLLCTAQREISFDEFLLSTRFSIGKLSIVLLNLELKGIISKCSGNSYIQV